MTIAWEGLPDHPERKGWHIILDNTGDRHEFWWEGPDYQYWTTCEGGDLIWSIEEMAAEYSYAGAVYSSSELAQMRKDERERCAGVFDQEARDFIECMKDTTSNLDSLKRAHDEAIAIADKIRALTDDEGKN